jgi:predicted nucleotide-binding protein
VLSNLIKSSTNFFVNEMLSKGSTLSKDASKVFVVHGRNEAARMAIFDFLRVLDLKPVEWNEAIALTGKPTPSIDEILDAAFDETQAILVLLTGDDLVRLGSLYSEKEKQEEALLPQPRPNILFEAGLALGRKSNRTILVQLGDIRQISDITGKHIVRLDNSTEKRLDLMSRLHIAGCYFNASLKKNWLKTGAF